MLDWAQGRAVNPEVVGEVCRQLTLERVVNQQGFVSAQRFYLYAAPGLARERVVVWVYETHLHIAYHHQLLAQYQQDYDRQRKRVRSPSTPYLYPVTSFSPQLELFELDEVRWQRIRPRPYQRQPLKELPLVEQLAFRFALYLLTPPLWWG